MKLRKVCWKKGNFVFECAAIVVAQSSKRERRKTLANQSIVSIWRVTTWSEDNREKENRTYTEVINIGGGLAGSLFYIPSVPNRAFTIALVRPLGRVSRLCGSCIRAHGTTTTTNKINVKSLLAVTLRDNCYQRVERRQGSEFKNEGHFNVGDTNRRTKMPETSHHMNGYANGHAPAAELQQDTTFLFTSESVGEGHPGKSLLPFFPSRSYMIFWNCYYPLSSFVFFFTWERARGTILPLVSATAMANPGEAPFPYPRAHPYHHYFCLCNLPYLSHVFLYRNIYFYKLHIHFF